MLDTDTKRRIDTARDILVGKVPDPKSQFKVNFSCVGPVPDEAMGAVMERREKVMEEIMFAYSAPTETVEKKKPAGKRKF